MRALWRAIFRRRSWERDLEDELQSHLEGRTNDLVGRGLARDEALRQARIEFGSIDKYREECRQSHGLRWFDEFRQDLRYVVRTLRRSPGFTAVGMLSLALGIGANTAVFSVIHAVLLRPLPYPGAGRLVRVAGAVTDSDVSIPEYEFWKEHASVFASAAGERGRADRNLIFGGKQEWIKAMTVTADFFRTLGVRPTLGREFNADETRAGGPQAVVLTDSLWRRSFGADAGVLGRAITLDDDSYVVVGVLPRGFWYPQPADAFVPLRPTGSLSDRGMNTQMIARLKPGVSLQQAQAEMPTLTEGIRRLYAGRLGPKYRGLTVLPYQKWLVGDVRLNLILLFGAVGLLLLIACANLASLLLARLAARRKEIAMRLALGCSRGRLLRQFLIENLTLTSAGGLAGLIGAGVLLKLLVTFIPFNLPTAAPIRLDAPVLGYALAVALATGMIFGLLPISSATRPDLHDALKAGGRASGAGDRQRVRSVLVVSEVALSVMVLASAGLLIQTLYRLHQEPLGFRSSGLVTFSTPFAVERRQNPADLWRYESMLLERLRALPGVRGAAAINVLPLSGWSNLPTQREGHPENSIGGMEVRYITPDYFAVMGVPVRRGRSLLDSDTAAGSPVILVNERLARQWWPNGNPLGDRVVIGRFQGRDFGRPTPRQVVGVVADTKTSFLKEPAQPTVYVPAAQNSDGTGGMTWILRTNSPAGLAAEARQAIAEIDPRQRLGAIRTMGDVVSATTANSRFDAWLFGFLAGLALALTAIGVYGVVSFSVARRTHEIGTRMALGASRARVLGLVLRQGIGLIAAGLVLGLAGALGVTQSLETLLFAVRATDPLNLLTVSGLLLAVGTAASYFPARRASKLDPMVALRDE